MAPDELNEIIFLDIETAPAFQTLDEVSEDLKDIWKETHGSKKKKKTCSKSKAQTEGNNIEDSNQNGDSSYEAAGLYAEFGKIICISLGRFDGGIKDEDLKVHSIASDDEKEILRQFSAVLEKYSSYRLCAHNGKGFDFPFIGRRYLINQIPLPSQFQLAGKKPWEILHLDTMEMWAFGQRQSSISLKLLCAVFGIPSPKDDIDGSQVRSVYYEERNLSRIVKYCEKDVISLAKVYKRICERE